MGLREGRSSWSKGIVRGAGAPIDIVVCAEGVEAAGSAASARFAGNRRNAIKQAANTIPRALQSCERLAKLIFRIITSCTPPWPLYALLDRKSTRLNSSHLGI